MSFTELEAGKDIFLSAGKFVGGGLSDIAFAEILNPKTSTIKAGQAITLDATGKMIPYDGTKFVGINVAGTTDLGKFDSVTPNPEYCPRGLGMVVLKTGDTQPVNGTAGIANADGTFSAGAFASKVGVFTGKAGEKTTDGNLVTQLRF